MSLRRRPSVCQRTTQTAMKERRLESFSALCFVRAQKPPPPTVALLLSAHLDI